jgi:hypothetical protein
VKSLIPIRNSIGCLLACVMLVCGQQSKSQDNSESETDKQMLVYLWTARDLDAKCHVLKPDEKVALDAHIVALLKSTNITEGWMKEHMGATPVEGTSCDGEVSKALFSFARAKPEQKSEQDKDSEEWKDIQDSWHDNFKNLPAGTLGAFEGCWTGNLGPLEAGMCLLQKGDLVRFRLGSAANPHCTFGDGSARRREDLIIFFTPAVAGRKCSDGTMVQHAEGGCNAISEKEMKCTITVYSQGNTIYNTAAGKTVNGTITMVRANQ